MSHPPTQFNRSGILYVVSGPSGSGKSTLCANVKQSADFQYSISHTTRPKRPGEEQGVDYWFDSDEAFERRKAAGEFLEWANVHHHQYATPKAATREAVVRGVDLLLDIDVQGADQIRASGEEWIQRALVDIFIMPPTMEELARRLSKRGTETPEQIATRMATARREIAHWPRYRYTILSGTMEEDLSKFRAIIRAERYRSDRLTLCVEG